MISCDINDLAADATCFRCLPRSELEAIKTSLLCSWAGGITPPVTTIVIVNDGTGSFWQLVVDPQGNVGAESSLGPATPDVVLADGFGGFWELIINPGGLVGSSQVFIPATVPPVLSDGAVGFWTIVVDQVGNIGATSV